MHTLKFTVKDYLRANIIVHVALMAGQFFFILTTLIVISEGDIAPETNSFFIYLVPGMVLMAFLLSNFIYRQKMTALRDVATISEKFKGFRSLIIIRSAILEGSGFLSIIAFMLTGELLYAGLSLLIILYMLTFIPTKQRMINDLELNSQEEAFINNPDNEIEGFDLRNKL